jgi:hypothetical protein
LKLKVDGAVGGGGVPPLVRLYVEEKPGQSVEVLLTLEGARSLALILADAACEVEAREVRRAVSARAVMS